MISSSSIAKAYPRPTQTDSRIWIFALGFLSTFVFGFTEIGRAEPSEVDLETWLTALEDPSYAKREWAKSELHEHRLAVYPLVIQKIDSTSGECQAILIQFLASLLADDSNSTQSAEFEEMRLAAKNAIKRIAQSGVSSNAFLAQKINASFRHQLGVETWQRLIELKMEDHRSTVIMAREFASGPNIWINEQFRGKASDLENLDCIDGVEFVHLEGKAIERAHLLAVLKLPRLSQLQLVNCPLTNEDLQCLKDGPDLKTLELNYIPIDDSFLPQVAKLPITESLSLFGTSMSAKALEEAKTLLPDIDVNVSRGAFLGVQCDPNSVRVQGVTKDSAAEKFGLQFGDRIVSINGLPLTKFEELRKELAKFAPGESVDLEIERPINRFQFPDEDFRDPEERLRQRETKNTFPLRVVLGVKNV
jgi:hypothetical protein